MRTRATQIDVWTQKNREKYSRNSFEQSFDRWSIWTDLDRVPNWIHTKEEQKKNKLFSFPFSAHIRQQNIFGVLFRPKAIPKWTDMEMKYSKTIRAHIRVWVSLRRMSSYHRTLHSRYSCRHKNRQELLVSGHCFKANSWNLRISRRMRFSIPMSEP